MLGSTYCSKCLFKNEGGMLRENRSISNTPKSLIVSYSCKNKHCSWIYGVMIKYHGNLSSRWIVGNFVEIPRKILDEEYPLATEKQMKEWSWLSDRPADF